MDVLFHLMENETYDDVTIMQLVLESGYSRGTSYRYVFSKTAILNELFSQNMESYRQKLEKKKKLDPENIPAQFINFMWPLHHRLQLLAKNDLLIPLLTKNVPDIAKMLLMIKVPWRQAQQPDLNKYYYALIYSIGGFCVMLDTIFKEPILKEPKDIIDSLSSALMEITANINGRNNHIDASEV
ncbi:TetR/AcrR family transcriptional regulator [Lacticaseibacillus paracasei]|uniref:TetR/AcrR family transcriptional regulator n=1 Tax=Lacticaseibacillus paracasei TaxID=1597 RepID=UPI002ADEF05A|nr:TetR/AcrR family transcriptional regulator [Lacticaseibacillus paracasei]MEA0974414.1 TetR/AcrR family transcriptional regulator [Lacticaseibacillus paracasei]